MDQKRLDAKIHKEREVARKEREEEARLAQNATTTRRLASQARVLDELAGLNTGDKAAVIQAVAVTVGVGFVKER